MANSSYIVTFPTGTNGQPNIAIQPTQTANFTPVANNYYPVSPSTAAITANLPVSQINQQLYVKNLTGAFPVNLFGTINGNPNTTLPLRLTDQGKYLLADGNGGWNPLAADLSVAALDARYAQVTLLTAPMTMYVTGNGNDTNNGLTWGTAKASINGALSALPASGGSINLSPDTFNVTSSARTLAGVTVTASGTTWTVNTGSVTSADVGKYIVGVNVVQRVPKILSVSGSTFTTDIAPGMALSASPVIVVAPGFVLPENVSITGAGPVFQNNSMTINSSRVLDSGNGITCLIRGANMATDQSNYYGLNKFSIWGTAQSTMFGLFVGNGAWFIDSDQLDTSFHGIAGIGLDCNINSHDFRNTYVSNNGKATSTGFTGGLITHPYNGATSASGNFYNSFFINNYGFGIADGQGAGAYGVAFYNPQFNNTNTNASPDSGYSAVLGAPTQNGFGRSLMQGGWSETAATGDLHTYGSVVVIGTQLYSSTPYAWLAEGNAATAIGVSSYNHTTGTFQFRNGGNLNWMGLQANDPMVYAGTPTSYLVQGMGTTSPLISGASGVSSSNFGYSNAAVIWHGSGAPSNSNGNSGDVYFRTDTPGTPGQQAYIKNGGTWVPISGTSAGGGISRSISAITNATNAGAAANTDYVYYWTGSTAYALVLPTAVGNTNRYTVKNTGTVNQFVTFTSGQNADGTTSIQINPGQFLEFISNNTNYMIG